MAFDFGGIGSILSGVGAAGGLFGGKEDGDRQAEMFGMNMEMQKEFAQRGIRWRVNDAKAAGINPLFALGAPVQSYTPGPIGGSESGSGVGDALSGIGNAMQGYAASKVTNSQKELEELQLRQARAQTEMAEMDVLLKGAQTRTEYFNILNHGRPGTGRGVTGAGRVPVTTSEIEDLSSDFYDAAAFGQWVERNKDRIVGHPDNRGYEMDSKGNLTTFRNNAEIAEKVFGETGGFVEGASNIFSGAGAALDREVRDSLQYIRELLENERR